MADFLTLAYYKDRNGKFVDVNGVVHGTCVQDLSDDFNCVFYAGLPATVQGASQLRCTFTSSPPPPPPVKPSVSVMVVGDSISHGMEGDWTWRWRIFAWCKYLFSVLVQS